MPTTNNKFVFFGSSSFGLPALKLLLENGYQPALIITLPDEPAGRNRKLKPTPIKIFCRENNVLFAQPEKLKNEEFINSLKKLNAEFAVVASYGKIIPDSILNLFPKGCLNLHPSLLPKYRGPSPVQTAILNGDSETGITIIKLDKEMDHGPIIQNSKFKIQNFETAQTLLEALSEVGGKLLIDILPDYLNGKISPQPQADDQATYTFIINKEAGLIDWQKPAVEIERQIRAFYPWPGSYTEVIIKNEKKIRVKIIKASVSSENFPKTIGEWATKNGQLFVRCNTDSLIIEQIQPEGKKEMSGKEFINGYFS